MILALLALLASRPALAGPPTWHPPQIGNPCKTDPSCLARLDDLLKKADDPSRTATERISCLTLIRQEVLLDGPEDGFTRGVEQLVDQRLARIGQAADGTGGRVVEFDPNGMPSRLAVKDEEIVPPDLREMHDQAASISALAATTGSKPPMLDVVPVRHNLDALSPIGPPDVRIAAEAQGSVAGAGAAAGAAPRDPQQKAGASLADADSALGVANAVAAFNREAPPQTDGIPSVPGGGEHAGSNGVTAAPVMASAVGFGPGSSRPDSGGARAPGVNDPTREITQAAREALTRHAHQTLQVVEKKLAGQKTPQAAQAYAKVAQGYAALGDNASALGAVNESLKLAPDDVRSLDLRASLRAAAGDAKGASVDAQHALALDPGDQAAQLVLGHSVGGGFSLKKFGFGSSRDLAGSQSSSMPAVRATPEQRRKADAEFAALAAGIAPGETPASKAQAFLQAAVQKLSVGDVQGSLFDVSRALMEDPKSVRSFILRAHISNLPKVHNYAAALTDADKALALDPQNAAAHFEKGYAQLLLGDAREAVKTLSRGVALEPKSAMGHLFLAMALEKAGAKDEALAEYKKAAALDPTVKPVADEAAGRMTQLPETPARSSDAPLWIVVALGSLLGAAAAWWRARRAAIGLTSAN